MSAKNDLLPPQRNAGLGGGGGGGRGEGGGRGGEKAWELRPGGMLVQKRTDADKAHVPPPTIRVRVKYGSIYHEMYISSQATFGNPHLPTILSILTVILSFSLFPFIYFFVFVYDELNAGELKKMLSGPTGLHHQDQKLFYKDKERDSNAFLDTSGVKDKSKIVLQQDPVSQEKRYLEMRKNAKMEKAAKTVSEISSEVDKLAAQVISSCNIGLRQ